MKLKKLILFVLAAVLLVTAGCSSVPGGAPQKPAPGPEVGLWHAEYTINKLDESSMSEEDLLILSLIAGNVIFDVYVEFYDNGDFKYTLDTKQMEESISGALNTIIGWFIDFNLKTFVNNLVQVAYQDMADAGKQYNIGTYTVHNGTIEATTQNGEKLYFRIFHDDLTELDSNGNDFLLFERSAPAPAN